MQCRHGKRVLKCVYTRQNAGEKTSVSSVLLFCWLRKPSPSSARAAWHSACQHVWDHPNACGMPQLITGKATHSPSRSWLSLTNAHTARLSEQSVWVTITGLRAESSLVNCRFLSFDLSANQNLDPSHTSSVTYRAHSSLWTFERMIRIYFLNSLHPFEITGMLEGNLVSTEGRIHAGQTVSTITHWHLVPLTN